MMWLTNPGSLINSVFLLFWQPCFHRNTAVQHRPEAERAGREAQDSSREPSWINGSPLGATLNEQVQGCTVPLLNFPLLGAAKGPVRWKWCKHADQAWSPHGNRAYPLGWPLQLLNVLLERLGWGMARNPAWASLGLPSSFSGELSVNPSGTHRMHFPSSPHMELEIQWERRAWGGVGVWKNKGKMCPGELITWKCSRRICPVLPPACKVSGIPIPSEVWCQMKILYLQVKWDLVKILEGLWLLEG